LRQHIANTMKSKLPLIALLLTALAVTLYAESSITADDAAKKLKAGAVLVDVRTVEEYASNHLAISTNIPLDTIKTGITNVAHDKSAVVLLHCRSGRRSGIAEKELHELGYTNVFNIGSYEQAEAVVKTKAK
jgi:phage shock protein E